MEGDHLSLNDLSSAEKIHITSCTFEPLAIEEVSDTGMPTIQYRLYKRRFAGLVALIFLNIIAGMAWPWFGPISNNMATEFNITLDEVNWLGNIISCVYLPTSLIIPKIVSLYGIRRCCDVGAVGLILSAWLRYAGTPHSLSPSGAYALLIVGQFFASIPQAIYQVIGPKYSETWFGLEGRTTATMLIAIANPFGGALGQLLSPLVGNTRQSILVLGIMSTAVTPLVFLIGKAPPTPPTYAASKETPSLITLCRATLGMNVAPDAYMSVRERFDFAIIFLIFSVLSANTNTFAIISAQVMQPMGYSADVSGFMGACLLLSGMVAAIVSAPLIDRFFTHHLARLAKVLVPFIAVGWLSLIWAVRPNNTAALFVIMAAIGICSITMLPIALELACELTRNADGSSALVWFGGNLFGIIFVLACGALRAGPGAHPPLNMSKALIFLGVIAMAICSLVFLLRGEQKRKLMDEEKLKESAVAQGLPTCEVLT
ncbi:MFS general substrate transporter [Phlegmacium glaucopus]|nr:MFS general substrate transporter [Phlegmacium glaucopus]